jgi:hypothetical protein
MADFSLLKSRSRTAVDGAKERSEQSGFVQAGEIPVIKQLAVLPADLPHSREPAPETPTRRGRIMPVIPIETENPDKLPPPAAPHFKNEQLSLFQSFLCNNEEERDCLSNAIDLWDSVPRYCISRKAMAKQRINGRFLNEHQAQFQHRGRTYTRTIFPALVTDLDGVKRYFYPSATEELVEDALRKLAIEQQAGYFDQPNYRSGVVFSLYMAIFAQRPKK